MLVQFCGEFLAMVDEVDDQISEVLLLDEEEVMETHHETPLIYPSENGEMKLEVTCPRGISEGNTIVVSSPFGTRKMPVACPKGIQPGDTFHVTLPNPRIKTREPEVEYFSLEVERFFTPVPTVVGETIY